MYQKLFEENRDELEKSLLKVSINKLLKIGEGLKIIYENNSYIPLKEKNEVKVFLEEDLDLYPFKPKDGEIFTFTKHEYPINEKMQ